MISETRVREVLNTITDPCSVVAGVRAGLDDMGLVRSVRVEERDDGCHVVVAIGVTEPGCLMFYPFASEAEERLRAVDEIDHVDVEIDASLDWHPDDMSADYRERLAAHRAARDVATDRPVEVALPARDVSGL